METDTEMLLAGLAFLAMHHERARDEAERGSADEQFTYELRSACRRVARHHQEQLYLVGLQTALLGGRNAYPRPVFATTISYTEPQLRQLIDEPLPPRKS